MVKTPKTRHSRPQKDPLTIDLNAEAVPQEPDSEQSDAEKSAEESASVFEAQAGDPLTAPAQGSETDPDRFIGSEWPPEQPAEALASAEPAAETNDDDLREPEPAMDRGDTKSAPAGTEGSGSYGSSPSLSQPAPVRRSGSLIGGLVGGAVALAAVGALQFAGFWPGGAVVSAPATDVSALEADIAALQQQVEALKGTPGVDLGPLQQAVADSTARADELTSGLEGLRTDVEALKSAVQSGGAGDAAAVAALVTRIDAIEKSIASLGQAGGAAPAEVAALSDRVTAVESALQTAREEGVVDAERLTAAEQALNELKDRIAMLGDQPKVAMALAAAALKAALDRGGPFAAEVETFAVVAPDAPGLADLRRIAIEGVATREALAASFEAAATPMITAGQVIDENAGFFQRLWASAQSLVTVRPIGAVEGEGVPETVARMEQAIKDGDLARALAEYDSLPEAVKAAGAEFGATLGARVAAEQLVDKALADALKAA